MCGSLKRESRYGNQKQTQFNHSEALTFAEKKPQHREREGRRAEDTEKIKSAGWKPAPHKRTAMVESDGDKRRYSS
jgi:hypothetical protein